MSTSDPNPGLNNKAIGDLPVHPSEKKPNDAMVNNPKAVPQFIPTMTAAQAAQFLEEKKFQYQQEKDKIEHDLAAKRIDLDTAIARTNEAHNRVLEDLQKRGQDITGASQAANNAAGLLADSLPYMAPVGTNAAIGQTMKGNITGLPSAPFPYDPGDFVTQITAQALKDISPYAAKIAGVNQVFTAPDANGQVK